MHMGENAQRRSVSGGLMVSMRDWKSGARKSGSSCRGGKPMILRRTSDTLSRLLMHPAVSKVPSNGMPYKRSSSAYQKARVLVLDTMVANETSHFFLDQLASFD